jgi:hypothetical protein
MIAYLWTKSEHLVFILFCVKICNFVYFDIKDTLPNSLVVKLKATVRETSNSSVEYAFAYNGSLTNQVNEFLIRNTTSGEIYLNRNLNTSIGYFREVIFAFYTKIIIENLIDRSHSS